MLGAAPRAFLFDLDGTLVATMQIFADVAAHVMRRHHGLAFTDARRRYLATSGIPFFQQLELICPDDPRNADAAAEFERRKVDAARHVVPDAETLADLAALRARGVALAVSSNNLQRHVDHFVASCSIRFELALGFGDGLAKGEPHVRRVCEALACERDSVVFVGDSIADAKLARLTNVRFVARTGTFTATQLTDAIAGVACIDRLRELEQLFTWM